MGRRRRTDVAPSSLTDHFVMHSHEFRTGPAWRLLPDNARRLVMCFEEEHMRLGGGQNGRLGLTYGQIVEKADIREASIPLALRQAVALKFVEVTRRGYKSVGGDKFPSTYRLTHVWGRAVGERGRRVAVPPTDEWRLIETDEQALEALAAARDTPNKRPRKPSAKLRSVA